MDVFIDKSKDVFIRDALVWLEDRCVMMEHDGHDGVELNKITYIPRDGFKIFEVILSDVIDVLTEFKSFKSHSLGYAIDEDGLIEILIDSPRCTSQGGSRWPFRRVYIEIPVDISSKKVVIGRIDKSFRSEPLEGDVFSIIRKYVSWLYDEDR